MTESWLEELERVVNKTNWSKTVNCEVCNMTKEVPFDWRLKKTCGECLAEWRKKYTKGV